MMECLISAKLASHYKACVIAGKMGGDKTTRPFWQLPQKIRANPIWIRPVSATFPFQVHVV
jgi:hypothetical protein